MSENAYNSIQNLVSSRELDDGFTFYMFWVTAEKKAEIDADLAAGRKTEDDIITELNDGDRAQKIAAYPCGPDFLFRDVVRDWHDNGKVGQVTPYQDGLPNGSYEERDDQGNIAGKGILKNNKNIGLWYMSKAYFDSTVSDKEAENYGPWYFFTDDQDEPIASADTPQRVMEQAVVEEYLNKKGLRIIKNDPYLLFRLLDTKEDMASALTFESLMLDREVVEKILMDRADVPWFDPIEAGLYPPDWKEGWQDYWQKKDGIEPSESPSPEPF